MTQVIEVGPEDNIEIGLDSDGKMSIRDKSNVRDEISEENTFMQLGDVYVIEEGAPHVSPKAGETYVWEDSEGGFQAKHFFEESGFVVSTSGQGKSHIEAAENAKMWSEWYVSDATS